jgi:flagellar biogenesis protein FliO
MFKGQEKTNPIALTGWAAAAFFMLACLFAPAAHAVTALKQVQVSNGSQIDLLFDGKVQKGQIRTEFVNDIIQLSIQDASVYPAKISAVNGGNLTKIFAYQYAPKLVRCRLTVKGKAEDYKDKLEIKAGGRILTIRMEGAAAAAKTAQKPAPAPNEPDAEERALLSRVMAGAAAPDAAQAQGGAQAAAAATKEKEKDKEHAKAKDKDSITTSSAATSTENLPVKLTGEGSAKLGGAKPLPSPLKAFGKMGIVLGIFGLLALGLRRYARSRSDSRIASPSALTAAATQGGWLSALGQIAKKGLGGRNTRMIEVLSTHYLGPKKSIAVVRVADRVLVLGVSNESINLITQLSGEDAAAGGQGIDGLDLADLVGPALGGAPQSAAPKAAQQHHPAYSQQAGSRPAAGAGPSFSDLLSTERSRPSGPSFANPSAASAYSASAGNPGAQKPGSNVRAQIRSRLEGLKPL